ncbi:MAG: site-specific integrase [Bacteroidota bacterium]|nr:site-specific integrase [Bacteroidota bacterium]
MEITTKVWLLKKREKKNGKYPVKIKVIFNRLICFYQTGVDLTEEEFKEYHRRKDLKKQFEDIIYYLNKADKIINDLGRNFSWKEFDTLYYNRQAINPKTTNQSQSINIVTHLEDYAEKLYKEGSIKTSKGYTTTVNHLKDYLKKKDDCLLFSDITPEFLVLLEKYFLSSDIKLSYSSIGVYMRNIRTVFNQAISKKIISSELYPFGKGKYVPPSTKKAKKALTIDEIEKIYNYKPDNFQEARAKDLWLFAYFANGLNVKDIAFLKYENIKKDVITFIRAKTIHSTKDDIQNIEVFITQDIQRIIDKWGKKPQKSKSFIFDILHPNDLSDLQIYRDINQAVRTINKYMKRIAENLKLEKVPTTNFARHSFSTVLKRAGVPIEMISEQLGHTSIKTTEIYLGSFESDQKREITKYLTSFKTKEQTTLGT